KRRDVPCASRSPSWQDVGDEDALVFAPRSLLGLGVTFEIFPSHPAEGRVAASSSARPSGRPRLQYVDRPPRHLSRRLAAATNVNQAGCLKLRICPRCPESRKRISRRRRRLEV